MQVIGKDNPPLIDKMMGSIHSFERGPGPWHEDAFPEEFKEVGSKGARGEGWFALDAWGNAIGFIPDGTVVV